MDIFNLELSDFKNQYDFFQEHEKYNLERSREELRRYFEKIDQEIFDAPWRKNKGYIPDGFKSRTISLLFMDQSPLNAVSIAIETISSANINQYSY